MDLMNINSDLPPPMSVLQPSHRDNLMKCTTPVQKKPSEVSFITPLRTSTGRLKTTNCRDGFSYLNSKMDKMGAAINERLDENYNHEEQEKLQWQERVEIVTKEDHKAYTESAKSFVNEMISNAVTIADNKSNFKLPKKSSLKQSNYEPPQQLGNLMFSDDDFVDGSVFAQSVSSSDWDILASKGSSTSEQTDLSRQSLFAKFDPLYSKRQAPQQELPRKSDIIDLVSYVPADTKDNRSRVTKSSVDFFFESPPALASIEEEDAFQFKSEEQKPSQKESQKQHVTNSPSLVPIVDVLNYTASDIHRLILQHREKLKKKEEECLKGREKLLQEKSEHGCLVDSWDVDAREKIETNTENFNKQKELLALYQKDMKEIVQATDKIKNTFYGALEKKFDKMRVLQSNQTNNLKQLQESFKKAKSQDLAHNITNQQSEIILKKIKSEKENLSRKAQEVRSKVDAATSRADLKKSELESNIQKTAMECEELDKICEELMK